MDVSAKENLKEAVEKFARDRLDEFNREMEQIIQLFESGKPEEVQEGLGKCKNLVTIHPGEITQLQNDQVKNHPDDRSPILDFVRSLADTDPCSSVQLLGELSSDTKDIELILGGIGFLGVTRSTEDGVALPPYTFQDAWTAASQIAWRSDDPDALNKLYNQVQQVASSLEGIVDSVSLKTDKTQSGEISSETLQPLYEILRQPLFDVCIHSDVKVQIQNFLNSKKEESYAATLQLYARGLLKSRLEDLQPSPERNGLREWLRGLRIYAQRVLG
jgi:hypothetical protein